MCQLSALQCLFDWLPPPLRLLSGASDIDTSHVDIDALIAKILIFKGHF